MSGARKDIRVLSRDDGFKAVIFDMDGLIFDTEELYYRTHNHTLGRYGASLPRSGYVAFVGHPVEDNSRCTVEHFGLNTTPDAFCKDWMQQFDRAISAPGQIDVMPGFLDLLAHLRLRHYRLAIASATERSRMMKTLTNGLLPRLSSGEGLDDIFEVMASGNDVARTKPAPDIYLLAASLLRVNPPDCLVFEDSESGVRSGKAAGMTVVSVPNFFTAGQDHSEADVQVASLEEVLNYL